MALVDRVAVAGRAALRPLEEHVFEQVGDAGAEQVTLVNAARSHPRLDAHHRRAAVRLHEQSQPIRQHVLAGGGVREMDRACERIAASLMGLGGNHGKER